MNWFFRIIFGVLRIRFYGENKEKILSACAQNGISLWSTKLTDKGIECDISVKDFKYLKYLIRNRGIRVHILRKFGLPFVIKRYNRRVGIVLGFIVFFTTLTVMSQYIWIIDINGNNKVGEEEIRQACREIGIVTGIPKSSIYPKAAREKLMLKLDGAAWASINIEGSRLSVNISESTDKAEKSTYSNLKAVSDGVIKKIDVVSGTVVVKVGQAVKKGDLLVSGVVETAFGTSFVNAKGTVYADSQKFITFNEGYVEKINIPTGKTKTKRILELFGVKIPLYLGAEAGEYIESKSVKNVELFGSALPVKIHKKTFVFQREITKKYDYDKLCLDLQNQLSSLSEEENYTVSEKEFSTNKNGVTLKALVQKRENIAVKEKILINAGK